MARRIVHLITGLPRGGAEMMLYKLLSRMDRSQFDAEVIALKEEGPMAERIRRVGVPVDFLGMRSELDGGRALVRLIRRLRARRPDVVQTWLYHADLMGGIAAKVAGRIPTVWGVRMSTLDTRAIKASTIRIARICARLSRWLPERIVCCSEAGRRAHVDAGYDPGKMTVIPNGFDLEAFRPDAAARTSFRKEIGVPSATPLVGLVGRFDPHKDHESFIAAAGKLASRRVEVRFVLVGDGVDPRNPEISKWIDAHGIRDRAFLLGARDDVPRIAAALDVAVSSSLGEAFSNTLGEAMACGVPCAATDVGDSAAIVGDTGKLVRPRDSAALAAAIEELLAMAPESRAALGLAARARIADRFSLDRVVKRYEELYVELAEDARH